MASPATADIPQGTASTKPIDVPNPNPGSQWQHSDQGPADSSPMELRNLGKQRETLSGEEANLSPEPTSTAQLPLSSQEEPTQTRLSSSRPPSPPQTQTEASSQTPPKPSIEPAPAPLTREPTAPAIGPSSDQPLPLPSTTSPSDTEKSLTLTLLLTNGARHPYVINEKYLKKRNVNVEDNNPVEMSIYTLKELIWREWRDEWEVRPSSPSSIRLIYAGGMPGDSLRLSGMSSFPRFLLLHAKCNLLQDAQCLPTFYPSRKSNFPTRLRQTKVIDRIKSLILEYNRMQIPARGHPSCCAHDSQASRFYRRRRSPEGRGS